MVTKPRSRPDLLLLVSLLLVILLNPIFDHGDLRKLILTAMTFVPVILATIRLSEAKRWVWPSVLLMLGAMIFGALSTFIPNQVLFAIKWGLLSAFYGLTVIGLFSYLKNARSVIGSHLYTAVSIYLMLGMLWAALYCAIDAMYPDSFALANNIPSHHQSELLYFSLVTLSTIGYGDVVPLHGEVRMLAAMEGVTGVLYVAITVALLVNSYKQQGASSQT
jgi:Ion channel